MLKESEEESENRRCSKGGRSSQCPAQWALVDLVLGTGWRLRSSLSGSGFVEHISSQARSILNFLGQMVTPFKGEVSCVD